MAGDPYVAARNDAGQKSLSLNEIEFLRGRTPISNVARVDGRRYNDIRKVHLDLGRWDNGAKSTVRWGGGTRIVSLCSAELVPPPPDRPNEGVIDFSLDLSPMAGVSFRQSNPVSTSNVASLASGIRGPNHSDLNQRLQANRIVRCIERVIVAGGALDTEALVVLPGKWVWRLTVALTVMDDQGNVMDACVLAAISSLRHYRKPKVDLSGTSRDQSGSGAAILPVMIPSVIREATPLPLHHTPLCVSFALLSSDDGTLGMSPNSALTILVDPTDREELVQSGSLTIGTNLHSEVCLLDYGGGREMSSAQFRDCWLVAEDVIKKLCTLVDSTLQKADDQAVKERLDLLVAMQDKTNEEKSQPVNADSPFAAGIDPRNGTLGLAPELDPECIESSQAHADELYRMRALDYSNTHVAHFVKDTEQEPISQSSDSFLAGLLASASERNRDTLQGGLGDNLTSRPGNKEERANASTKGISSTLGGSSKPPASISSSEKVASSQKDTALLNRGTVEVQQDPVLETSGLNRLGCQTTVSANASVTDLHMTVKKKKKKRKKG